jgi:hypothetical protein
MKIVEDSLRDIIAFSEKQLASEMRRLKAEGNPKKNVKADAYATIIKQLSSILYKKGDGPKNDTSDKS